jgi:hypothetical protein
MQNSAGNYRMQGAHRLQFRLEMVDAADRFAQIESLLTELSSQPTAHLAVTGS